ncbi:hypothetical protein [Haloarcula onubensis]|uniref:Gp5/Type VI secretion system Vgr protein OB-fold domain-containing protein n=1 Tax=Haloarcula onubensis TaxID=2950539 RepID=A0ABU2FV77_9EURY|nr:hypothetical protein [Halomicroarcula sp. S3CR25-11]MDS0284680.1 hypothetical protein [Halomicroarcula sp. S3CR25-11]
MTEELEDTERARILSIVREEINLPQRGEVTDVYTHSSSDDSSNHEVDVQIPPGNNAVREHHRVPVGVPADGSIVVPREGDHVLVQYEAGDGERPLVTKVFYGDADSDRALLGDEGDVRVRRGDVEVELAGDGSFGRLALTPSDGGSPDLVVEVDSSGTIRLGDPDGTLEPIARNGDAVEDGSGTQVGTVVASSTDVESS